MNDTPTPRTDDSETRVRKNGFSSLIEYCYANDMAKLERELTAVTEQRDGIEAKLRIELRGHPDSELWGDTGLIAATMRCVDALDEATERRDEARETVESLTTTAFDLLASLGKARDERDEAVNNYETAQLLSVRVGEQRDRLAEALELFIEEQCENRPHEHSDALGNARKALQSLTPKL